MSQEQLIPVGIDISKDTFDVAVLLDSKRVKTCKFDNTPDGFTQLSQWLNSLGVKHIHACLEATNIYGNALATYLHGKGQQVSIINPSQIKGYAQSQLTRTKTDHADAGVIARFCRDLHPRPWQPAPETVQKLQEMSRRLEAIQKMMIQETNRLDLCNDPQLKADIQAHVDFLAAQGEALKKRLSEHIHAHEDLQAQKVLLCSIVGVADKTATTVLAELGSIEFFNSSRQLAAFAGLTPREFSSGTSVRGKTRLCKIGNPRLRKAMYFPALAAIRHCPEIREFYDRLLAAGKTKMQAIGAVMHKLIRIVYGVLHSKQPFDAKQLISLRTTPA